MNQNWPSLGPQENLVMEGWECMVGEVKGGGVAGSEVEGIFDRTRGEQQQGLPQGLGLRKAGSRLLAELQPSLWRDMSSWYRDQS